MRYDAITTYSTDTIPHSLTHGVIAAFHYQLTYEILRRLAEKDGSYEEAALMVSQ